MWFTVVTTRRLISLSFQPRRAAALLRSGSVVNSPTPTGGTFTRVPASFAGAAFYLVLPAEPRPGILKRGAGSGDPAYNQRVGGARGSFTFWFDLVLPEG